MKNIRGSCVQLNVPQYANVKITPVYWYFHCNFQQNIAVFCAISDLCCCCYSLTHRRSCLI